MSKRALAEISKHTAEAAGRAIKPVRGKNIERVNLRVPDVRKLAKTRFEFLSDEPSKNLQSWDYIWRHSACYEVMCQALYFYQYKELNADEVKTVLGWADRVTCWEHSDDLAKIYADAVEVSAKRVLPTLRKWNRSDNPWHRRLSMTGLVEYETKRNQVLPYADLMAFVEPLIDDDEYYVQKGLGWTVREIGNAYPKEFRQFLATNASRLSPQAWSGATKNFDKADKAKFMKLRKAGRS